MSVDAVGPFTQLLWDKIDPIFWKICHSEFVVTLAVGSIAPQSFAHYLQQDVLYLKDDNEALALLAQRVPSEADQRFFATLASDGIKMEQVVRTTYLTHFGVDEATEQSPAFMAYSQFLLKHASISPFEVAAAALLPCFWVYGAMGHHIAKHCSKGNPYQLFIDTYAGDEYNDYVRRYLDIVEDYGCNASSVQQQYMIEVFVEGVRHEMAVIDEAVKINRKG